MQILQDAEMGVKQYGVLMVEEGKTKIPNITECY